MSKEFSISMRKPAEAAPAGCTWSTESGPVWDAAVKSWRMEILYNGGSAVTAAMI